MLGLILLLSAASFTAPDVSALRIPARPQSVATCSAFSSSSRGFKFCPIPNPANSANAVGSTTFLSNQNDIAVRSLQITPPPAVTQSLSVCNECNPWRIRYLSILNAFESSTYDMSRLHGATGYRIDRPCPSSGSAYRDHMHYHRSSSKFLVWNRLYFWACGVSGLRVT